MNAVASSSTHLIEASDSRCHKNSATLHQARTICRRAERDCIRLSREEAVAAELNKYLNRLSDALFVMARWVSKTQGEPEFLWQRESDASTK